MRAASLLWLLCCQAPFLVSQQPAPGLLKAGRPEQQDSQDEHRDRQIAQRGTDSAPIVVGISPAQLEQLIASQHTEQGDQQSPYEWWQIAFTGILAVATILQWRATRALVTGAEKTTERQLRAYLSRADRLTYSESVAFDGITVELRARIRNDGQTPAHDVRAYGQITYRDIFGQTRKVTFLEGIAWGPDGALESIPADRDNRSD